MALDIGVPVFAVKCHVARAAVAIQKQVHGLHTMRLVDPSHYQQMDGDSFK